MDQFQAIRQALQDLRDGKIILVVDDPDRENEGDFICAAEFATTENINFMATHGKGLICMPMSEEYVRRLQIPQMVRTNTDNHETAFTVRGAPAYKSFSTYFPMISVSRLTGSPFLRSCNTVCATVWGIAEIEKEVSPTSATVRLIPSTVIEPFSTI